MNEAGLDAQRFVRPGGEGDPVVAMDEDFSAFVQARTPSLLRSAYLLTGDQHLAEDLVQSALARTHLSWRRLRVTDNAEAYTRKVMYHAQVNVWRRRRFREAALSVVPEPADLTDAPSHIDLRLSVWAALRRLTPKQRAVLVLRYLEDRSEAETANLLNVSQGTVKSQTSYALSRLRTLAPELAGLAGDVEVVNLEPQVRRTAQRIRRRRTAAAVVAAVAALAAMAGTILAIRRDATVPPVEPMPTLSSVPAPSGQALVMPRAVGTDAAYGCPGVSTQPRPAAQAPGKLFFWTFDDATDCAILSRISAGTITAIATVPLKLANSPGPFQTVALSPDATRIAWITNDTDQAGDLAVLTIGDDTPRLIGGTAFFSGGDGPVWEGDSKHLRVRTKDSGSYRVDATTGASEAAVPPDSYLTFSPNGAYQAYWNGKNLVVARADGTAVHTTPLLPTFECDCGFSTQSVSDDGQYVVLGHGNTDPGRVIGGKTIVDAASGTVVPVPVTPPAGQQVRQVIFAPGGRTVVVTESTNGANPRVYFVSATGGTSHTDLPELTGTIVLVRS
jgi:RNA polymerase sigma-70 factor (sigma-E family)